MEIRINSSFEIINLIFHWMICKYDECSLHYYHLLIYINIRGRHYVTSSVGTVVRLDRANLCHRSYLKEKKNTGSAVPRVFEEKCWIIHANEFNVVSFVNKVFEILI